MSNIDFRPEDAPPEGAPAGPITHYDPQRLSPELKAEIRDLRFAEQIRLASVPQSTDGGGDYISMT